MSKYTPGSWKVGGEFDGEPGVWGDDWHCARPVLGPNGEPIVWALWVQSDDELYFGFRSKADARLIAAAPDLLEASRALLRWVSVHAANGTRLRVESVECDDMRAAIAKATRGKP